MPVAVENLQLVCGPNQATDMHAIPKVHFTHLRICMCVLAVPIRAFAPAVPIAAAAGANYARVNDLFECQKSQHFATRSVSFRPNIVVVAQ